MLDKSIEYVNILMACPAGLTAPDWNLPDGFRYANFSAGNEADWAAIETSVLEFTDEEKARDYFVGTYVSPQGECAEVLKRGISAEKRCLFVETENGKKVATTTFWEQRVPGQPWIHWVSVRPEYQGLGLGKAVIAEALRRLEREYGSSECYLHTQTWSHKAVRLYMAAGFHVYTLPGLDHHDNSRWKDAIALLESKGCHVPPDMIFPPV